MPERCEWADTIGEGAHVDMARGVPPHVATCCDVGFIDGPQGLPMAGWMPFGAFIESLGLSVAS